MTALASSTQITASSNIITPENLGAKRRIHTVNSAGGIYDYRIDFSAFCLYGIWTCLLVWSGSFLRTNRALVVAVVGILLVYSRFFTIIYVGGVLGTLLAINTYGIWRNPSPYRTAVAARRIRNILLSATIIAAFSGGRL